MNSSFSCSVWYFIMILTSLIGRIISEEFRTELSVILLFYYSDWRCLLLLFDSFIVEHWQFYSEIFFGVKILPILVGGKLNLQWLKFTMVTTEMVSSTSNTARGFLPGGGLVAGSVATSSKILNNINQSSTISSTEISIWNQPENWIQASL